MKKLTVALVGLTTLLATSCTVSDPEFENVDGDGNTNAKVTSLTFFGMELVTYGYDGQGRMNYMKIGSSYSDEWNEITISYDPMEIVDVEYQLYYENDGSTVVREQARDIYNNITLNEAGLITRMTNHELEYYWYDTDGDGRDEQHVQYDEYTVSHLTYAGNRLLKVTTDDNSYTDFTWDSEGRLLNFRVVEPDSEPEFCEFTYSDVLNQHLQWDINLTIAGYIQVTGLFGLPPAYYAKSAYMNFADDDNESYAFSYRINKNGWIVASKCYSDGAAMEFNWNYDNRN